MTFVLADASPLRLAHAAQENLWGFFTYLWRSSKTEYDPVHGLARWHIPIPHPWYNGALVGRPFEEGDDRFLQDTVAWFWARDIEHFSLWLKPGLSKTGWDARLRSEGFYHIEDPPGMAVELDRLGHCSGSLSELQIIPVIDDILLQKWIRAFISGCELPQEWEPSLFDLISSLGWNLPIRYYLGILGDKAVATSSLFLNAGVAGIQFVSTRPHYRRRGIGAAITLAPALDALRLGYRIGVLQASEMGYPVYWNLGFREICRMEHYEWLGALHRDPRDLPAGGPESL